MKTLNLIGAIFLIVSVLPVFCAEPKVVETGSRVDAVTVFNGYANVTRVYEGDFEPGSYRLRISGMPAGIDNDSVRVSGKGTAAAQILNVKVNQEFPVKETQKKTRILTQKKKELQPRKLALQDQLEALNQRKKTLELLAEKTTAALSNKNQPLPPPLQSWKSMLDFQQKEALDIKSNRRKLESELEKLTKGEADLEQKLKEQWNLRNTPKKFVYLDLRVSRSGRLRMDISYIIKGVTWTPGYDLRVDSAGQQAELTCSAMISQQTGEDWKNVQLTLSTAKPMTSKAAPVLKPMFLFRAQSLGELCGEVILEDGSAIPGVYVEVTGENVAAKRSVVTNELGLFRITSLPPGEYQLKAVLEGFKTKMFKGVPVYIDKTSRVNFMLETGAIQKEVVVTGQSPTISVRKSAGSVNRNHKIFKKLGHTEAAIDMGKYGLALTFKVRHRETVRSNGSLQKAVIAVRNLTCSLEHYAVPRHARYAFIRALLEHTGDIPLLPGKVKVFYDGKFLNTSSINFVNPKETFEIPIGIDEAIKASHQDLAGTSDSKGMFKKKIQLHQGYRITLKSFHRTPVTLRVRDIIPVPMDKTIKVIPTRLQPKPEQRKKQAKAQPDGLMEWLVRLKPGEEKVIHLEYDLVYPLNARIEVRKKQEVIP